MHMDIDKVNIDEVNRQLAVLRLCVSLPNVSEQCVRCLKAGASWEDVLELVPNGRSLASRWRKRGVDLGALGVGAGLVNAVMFAAEVLGGGNPEVACEASLSPDFAVSIGSVEDGDGFEPDATVEIPSVSEFAKTASSDPKVKMPDAVDFEDGDVGSVSDEVPATIAAALRTMDARILASAVCEAPARPKLKMPDGLDDYGLKPRWKKDGFVEPDLSYVMKNWDSIWINGYPDETFDGYDGEVAGVLASNAGVVLSKSDFRKVVDRLKGGES